MTEADNFHDRHRALLSEAVRVLTAAARLTWTVDQGGVKLERQADFAEFISLAVAGAAANIGGIEELLAGRPGSWEADFVRRLLTGTVGEDEGYLLEHRTEPITVVVNVDDLLNDLGMWELYDEAEEELTRQEDVIAPFSPAAGIVTLTDEQTTALEAIDELRRRLDEQRRREWATYGDCFAANVNRAAAELLPKLTVPVEVVVRLDWQSSLGSGEAAGPDWQLWNWARQETPLPGSGIAFKDYPGGVSIAQAERDAGRRPLGRVEHVPVELPGAAVEDTDTC